MCVIVLQWKRSLAISKWRKMKTWTTLSTFYVFWHDTSKKRKKLFSNYAHSVAWLSVCRAIVNVIWGHFLLTYLLLDLLVSSAPSRVLTVSSKGHKYGRLDLDDVNVKRRWSSLKAYCRSKTANLLFSTHLARLLQGIFSASFCPLN